MWGELESKDCEKKGINLFRVSFGEIFSVHMRYEEEINH